MDAEAAAGHWVGIQKISAVSRRLDRVSLDDRVITRRANDFARRGRALRQTPVRRHWLTWEQIESVIARRSEEVAWAFLVQSLFMLRYDTLAKLEYCDIILRDEGTRIDIVIRKEKAPSDEGPRMIRGFPVRVRELGEASKVWEPVTRELVRRKYMYGEQSVGVIDNAYRFNKAGYERYLHAVKTMITLWTHSHNQLLTHDARRTGACLHFKEGWGLLRIALVGGWSIHDFSSLVKYLVQSLEVSDIPSTVFSQRF